MRAAPWARARAGTGRLAALGVLLPLAGGGAGVATLAAQQVDDPPLVVLHVEGVSSPESPSLAPEVARLAQQIFASVPRSGDTRFLMIPALFADSPEPAFTQQMLQQQFFDGPSTSGTLSAFYEEASMGQLTIRGTVTPWVRTDITRAEAADPDSGGTPGFGPRLRAYVESAIRAADPLVDFGEFDSDGPDGVPNTADDNGLIEVAIVFLEEPRSCGGPGIWPHLSGFNGGLPTSDLRPDGTPIGVQAYIAQGATDCGGGVIARTGVLAHEYGHLLGLPDYYTPIEGILPSQRHWNVGCYGLMAGGSWGCGSGTPVGKFGPVHFTAVAKERVGWLTFQPVVSVRNQEFTLRPVQTSGDALRMNLSSDGLERLIVEYRPGLGFDHQLPAGGILIYHQDNFIGQREIPAGLPRAASLHLIEADGDDALRKLERDGGNRGAAGDAWGTTSPAKLNAATTPGTRTHLGEPSTVTFHSVRIEDGVAKIRLSTAATPTLDAPTGLVPVPRGAVFERRWVIAGGAAPVTALLDSPPADATQFDVSVEEDELVVRGRFDTPGRREVGLALEDALGTTGQETLRLVTELIISPEAIVSVVVGSQGLTVEEALFLDETGNDNGRIDVGDLRAYLRRTGS